MFGKDTKIMKKFGALLLTLAILIGVMPMSVMAEEDTVEISFCVGDETLMINGEATTVEKPYVVGEGVTLVPLRVITEAFGAKVEWIGETKTIKLEYPDVNITLQIANSNAEVNGRAEELLSAPELTNGFTMVPLRFISETFGAEVGYDGETKRITVTKTKSEAGSLVEGAVTTAYIGDSYYGWTMENPTELTMEHREFDGAYTEFVYDENNGFYLEISGVPKDYDFEADYLDSKSALQGKTLVKADKSEENGIKKMHLQARDKKEFLNAIRIITDKYSFSLVGFFDNENTELKNELVKIMSTFVASYLGEDTYDLSNVDNGYRRFEADALNLSIDIPADHILVSDESAETDFNFVSIDENDVVSQIIIVAYSKSSVTGAKELAEADHTHNKRTVNESISKYGNVREAKYTSFDAYEYNYEITATGYSEYAKDVFFEKGDYVYNVRISVPAKKANRHEYITAILNNMQVTAPDSAELGDILRNIDEREGTFEDSVSGCKMTIPNVFKETMTTQTTATYIHNTNGVAWSVSVDTDGNPSMTGVKNAMSSYEKELNATPGVIITKKTASVPLGKNTFVTMNAKKTKDGETIYVETYATVNDEDLYTFTVIYPEISYSEAARTQMRNIISKVQFD